MPPRHSSTIPRPASILEWSVCWLALLITAVSFILPNALLGEVTNVQPLETQALGGAAPQAVEEELPYEFSAAFIMERHSRRGSIRVVVKLAPGHHIYSVLPDPTASALKTEIGGLLPNLEVKPFTPDTAPKFSNSLPGLEGTPVHWHETEVVWTASFELLDSHSPNTPSAGSATGHQPPPETLPLSIRAQVCSDICIPIDETLTATFAGYYDAPQTSELTESGSVPPKLNAANSFLDTDAMCRWTVDLSHITAPPGGEFVLRITAEPQTGFHLYAFEPTKREATSETLLVLESQDGISAGRIQLKPSHAAIKLDSGKLKSAKLDSAEDGLLAGITHWTIPLHIAPTHPAGDFKLTGWVGYQACSDEQCDQPRGFQFSIPFQIANDTELAPIAEGAYSGAEFRSVAYGDVAAHPERLTWMNPLNLSEGKVSALSMEKLGTTFCFALIGGLLLNFMPCVLPVIGLKVLGFVTEAAGDRKTASKLTLVYSAGIVGVILAFGIISLTARGLTGVAFGWGEHFGSVGFRIVSTAFMFALALSFLGIWEIPIPGFATSQTATQLSKRSGYLGALNKGIITTILATPCSAPFLGGALVVALTQPAWVVLLIFFGAGLGMALPYLIIGLYPRLLSFLPKPGPWMQTFKEFLAFPMLLAVVMFVNGFAGEQKIAMLASLIFLWFGCWLIGRIPAWGSFRTKSMAWAAASLITVAGTCGAFHWVKPSLHSLNWVPYNEPQLQELVQDGKTVLIDFTAEWCINCKRNLDTAIHTSAVKGMVESSGVVTMEADLTDYPDYIKKKLAELGSVSIPLIAIYPGDNRAPIILRDRVTETDVLEALQFAGSSKSEESATINSLESLQTSSTPIEQPIRRVSFSTTSPKPNQ